MSERRDKWKADAREMGAEHLPYMSYQCCIEEIIRPQVAEDVMSKSDWHDLCDDPDSCECPEHGSEVTDSDLGSVPTDEQD